MSFDVVPLAKLLVQTLPRAVPAMTTAKVFSPLSLTHALTQRSRYYYVLQAEQFLTTGFAEVKMRLLSDIVDLVMRTHHSLAQQGGSKSSDSSSSGNSKNEDMEKRSRNKKMSIDSNTRNSSRPSSCAVGWGVKSDGRGSGSSSPWNTPTPPPQHQQPSRPGSVESRCSGGGFSAAPPAPIQPRSPPLLCGGPHVVGASGSVSGGPMARHPSASSLSGLSDEQNAPPPGGGSGVSHRRLPLRAPAAPVHAPVPLHHNWHPTDPRAYYGGGGRGAASGGGGGSSVWIRGAGSSSKNRGITPQPAGRSPLGPRSEQGPPHAHIAGGDLDGVGPAEMGMLPHPLQGQSPGAVHNHGAHSHCANSGTLGGGQSDWLAVQQAFGSPSSLHMPLPTPVLVPSSPPSVPRMPKLPPRSVSSVAVAAAAAAHEASVSAGGQGEAVHLGGPITDGEQNHIHRVAVTPSRRSPDFSSDSGHDEGTAQRQQQQQHLRMRRQRQQERDDELHLAAELGKMQRQIEAMLERHSRTFDGRMTETEQMLSARLTLLETKVQGLEIGSPLHT